MRLCDAMVEWDNGAGKRPESSIIEEALRQPSVPVIEAANEAFSILLHVLDDPVSELDRIYRSIPAPARAIVVLQALWRDSIGRQDAVEFIAGALDDRSQLVRRNAWDVARRLDFRELVPMMESADLPNVDGREELDFNIALLRDGYIINARHDGEVSLTVRTQRGWTTLRIPVDVIDSIGAEGVACRYREGRLAPFESG